MKVYTCKGDKGSTFLVNGKRVSKDHVRIETYGTVDELCSVLGIAGVQLNTIAHQANLESFVFLARDEIQVLQNQLFTIGSHLACSDEQWRKRLPPLGPGYYQRLESKIDEWSTQLPELKEFILPGGCMMAAVLHQARTICRRAERHLVALQSQGEKVDQTIAIYLNRLSDYLFVFARYTNQQMGQSDLTWKK